MVHADLLLVRSISDQLRAALEPDPHAAERPETHRSDASDTSVGAPRLQPRKRAALEIVDDVKMSCDDVHLRLNHVENSMRLPVLRFELGSFSCRRMGFWPVQGRNRFALGIQGYNPKCGWMKAVEPWHIVFQLKQNNTQAFEVSVKATDILNVNIAAGLLSNFRHVITALPTPRKGRGSFVSGNSTSDAGEPREPISFTLDIESPGASIAIHRDSTSAGTGDSRAETGVAMRGTVERTQPNTRGRLCLNLGRAVLKHKESGGELETYATLRSLHLNDVERDHPLILSKTATLPTPRRVISLSFREARARRWAVRGAQSFAWNSTKSKCSGAPRPSAQRSSASNSSRVCKQHKARTSLRKIMRLTAAKRRMNPTATWPWRSRSKWIG